MPPGAALGLTPRVAKAWETLTLPSWAPFLYSEGDEVQRHRPQDCLEGFREEQAPEPRKRTRLSIREPGRCKFQKTRGCSDTHFISGPWAPRIWLSISMGGGLTNHDIDKEGAAPKGAQPVSGWTSKRLECRLRGLQFLLSVMFSGEKI